MHNTVFLIAILFAVQTSFAQDNEHKEKTEPKFKKTKSYSKSYPLSSSDKINLSNQFGEMKINTWDKNEVKVDVSITGKSDEEARAQQILDKISIEDSKSGNTVSFKTKFADDNKDYDNRGTKDKNTNEHHSEGMEINYVVFLPSGNSLSADNQFGKMIVPDYKGEVRLESKFGSLTAGKLSNTKEIDVEFGEANIGSINGGDLTIKFSSGTVNDLSGSIDCDLQFSQVKLVLNNDSKSLTINNSYSTVYLDLDKSFSATYDINSSHGGFTNKSSFSFKEEEEDRGGYGPHFNSRYKGSSGGGAAKVKVNASFGEVIVGHNMQVDLTEKHKEKGDIRDRDRNRSTKVI